MGKMLKYNLYLTSIIFMQNIATCCELFNVESSDASTGKGESDNLLVSLQSVAVGV